MPAYLLAIDQGTTSTRSILFDAALVPVAIAQQEITQIYPAPGWVEHDPEEIWTTTIATGREAIAKAQRSDAAIRKQTTGRTDDGLPVHSFQTLLADLGTYCRLQATTAINEKYLFTLHTRPTPTQQHAFELLGIYPDRTQ